MADVESTRPRRAKGLFTPSPSLQELKTPQRFVTIILSIVCIAFALVTVVCAAVTIAELKGFPDLSQYDSYRDLEDTRTQTRVVCGFVFVTAVATIVTRAVVIVITTLNFGFAKEFGNLVLIANIVSGLVCAAVFFALAVPMAVYSGEWIGYKNIARFTTYPDYFVNYFNLNAIIPSTGATSAFGFFTTFALIAAVFWVVLAKFIFKKADKNSNATV